MRVHVHSPIILPALLAFAVLTPPACAPSRPAAPEPPTATPPAAAATQSETRNEKPETALNRWPFPRGVIAKLDSAQPGYDSCVNAIAFSPDGKSLAAASIDNRIRLWEISTGKALRTFEGHTGTVLSIAFSPDGKTLASGSNDKTIRLWEVATGKELLKIERHKEVVWSIVFSPDGNTLASGSGDETMRLWEVTTGKEILRFDGHAWHVKSVTFSPDGKTLASRGVDETIRLWDVASAKERVRIKGPFSSNCAFSPDGKTLASGSRYEMIRLWETDSGKERARFDCHMGGIDLVAISPDGKRLSTVNAGRFTFVNGDGRFGFLDDYIPTLQDINSILSVTHDPEFRDACFGKNVHIWEIASWKKLLTLDNIPGIATSIVFSPDGNTMASGNWDNSILIWDVAAMLNDRK